MQQPAKIWDNVESKGSKIEATHNKIPECPPWKLILRKEIKKTKYSNEKLIKVVLLF
jgi:hypothetical protein